MNRSSSDDSRSSDFDGYAADYDRALAEGLAVSGEDKGYFAEGRIRWLGRRLRELDFAPSVALDFGCGTGSATPFLLDVLGAASVVGVDRSERSLEIARRAFATRPARFMPLAAYEPTGDVDLAFCNGVFHHVPPEERPRLLRALHRALRPKGLFALWENNPWNPGTRYVMSRIPFDRDARPLSAPLARRLLVGAGFEVLRTDFLFVFPRALARLRWIEPHVSRWPLGAQYQVLCRRA